MSFEAVFLDRDGVLNVERFDYVTRPEGLVLETGAAAAVRRLNQAGLPAVVVTNQAGVGRGLFDLGDLAAVQGKLVADLAAGGARVDGLYACTHHPDAGCECRKPRPGMLLEAAAALGFAARRAVLVGDTVRDLQAAEAAGATAVLVLTGKGRRAQGELAAAGVQPAAVLDDLPAAVDWILDRCAS